MYTQTFQIMLGLKHPNSKTTLDLDFRTLESDISNAIFHSNRRHGGYKTLNVMEIRPKSIILKMTISTEKGIKSPAREVSTFSRYLYNDAEWHIYSSVANRLFKILEYTEISEEALSTMPSQALPEDFVPYQNMSDDEMMQMLSFIIKNQDLGTEETISRRKNCINQIKKYILDVM